MLTGPTAPLYWKGQQGVWEGAPAPSEYTHGGAACVRWQSHLASQKWMVMSWSKNTQYIGFIWLDQHSYRDDQSQGWPHGPGDIFKCLLNLGYKMEPPLLTDYLLISRTDWKIASVQPWEAFVSEVMNRGKLDDAEPSSKSEWILW